MGQRLWEAGLCLSLFAGRLDWAVSAVNQSVGACDSYSFIFEIKKVTAYLYFSEVMLLFTVKEVCKIDIKNNINELLKLKLQELMKLVKHKNH